MLLAIWSNAPPRSILVTVITPYEQTEGLDQPLRSRVLVLFANGTACASGRKWLRSALNPSHDRNFDTNTNLVKNDDLEISEPISKRVIQSTNHTSHESYASKFEKKDTSVVAESLNDKSEVNSGQNSMWKLEALEQNTDIFERKNAKNNSLEKVEEGYTDQILISKPLYFIEAVRIVNGILLCGVEHNTTEEPLVRIKQKFECYTWHKDTAIFQKVANASAMNLTYVGFAPTTHVLFTPRPLILISTIRDEVRIGNPSRSVDNTYIFKEDHIYALARTDNYDQEPEDMFIIGKFETPENHGSLKWRSKPDVIQPPDISQFKGSFLCGVMFKLQLHLFDIQNQRYWRYHAKTKKWFKDDPGMILSDAIGPRLFPACGIYHNNLVYGGGTSNVGTLSPILAMDVEISGNGNKNLKQCHLNSIIFKIKESLYKNDTRHDNNMHHSDSSCTVLDTRRTTKFDLNVYGYSVRHSEWDPVYEFEKMKSNRMLHRFATLSDGHREYLMAVFGRTKWYDLKNTVDIFIHDYHNYWITEKIKGLPDARETNYKLNDDDPWQTRSMEPQNATEKGNFDFTTVVIPASWIPSCNHKLEWNNHEMLSRATQFNTIWRNSILIVFLVKFMMKEGQISM